MKEHTFTNTAEMNLTPSQEKMLERLIKGWSKRYSEDELVDIEKIKVSQWVSGSLSMLSITVYSAYNENAGNLKGIPYGMKAVNIGKRGGLTQYNENYDAERISLFDALYSPTKW